MCLVEGCCEGEEDDDGGLDSLREGLGETVGASDWV